MAIDPNWIIPLIITHIIPYVLIAWIIWVYQKRRDYYKTRLSSQILVQLGLIFLIASMLSEFMWHWLIQGWDYQNDTHVLNFLMYFFQIVGFTLWSMGLKREKITDVLLIVVVILTPIAYYMNIKPIIWIGQLIVVVVVTVRGKQVLNDNRVYLFIVFSFGVNMLFIMLLFMTSDPLYHILHDILGTLLGLFIFGYLFWVNPKYQESTQNKSAH